MVKIDIYWMLRWNVEALGSIEDAEEGSERTTMGICVISDQGSVLVDLAVFLAAPLDVDRVDVGCLHSKCLLVGDFVLVVHVEPEITGDECCWFAV